MKTKGVCEFADVRPDKAGRYVVRENAMYQCSYPIPEVVLPTSVTRAFQFRWPPAKCWVSKGECEACPCWVRKERAS